MKEGIYPALITPFAENETVDYDALCRLLDALMARGVDGFYVCGSTAEVMLLSIQERKKILETVVKHVDGKAAVVAHIGAQYTSDSIALAKHAASLGGISAISSLPPIYYKYTPEELSAYFCEVAAATPLPLIVYNAPALAGVTFNKDNLQDIFAKDNIIGIKFTSYDLYNLQRVHAAFPDKVIINGHDELFLNTLPLGLKHAIGSTFNFMPEKFVAIREAYAAGKAVQAYGLQDDVNKIIEGLIHVGVFRGVKAMLQLLGLPMGACRKPFAPISQAELQELRPLAEKCKRFD